MGGRRSPDLVFSRIPDAGELGRGGGHAGFGRAGEVRVAVQDETEQRRA